MRRSFCVAVVIMGLGATARAQGPTDWTQWRGPARDGVIASFTPPPTWPDALVKRWTVEIGRQLHEHTNQHRPSRQDPQGS